MMKTDAYLIKWYGPFESIEKVITFEEENPEVFNLYAFQAKMKSERN